MKNKRQKNQRFFIYDSFRRNRKGDIPIIILVIGVIAICGLALLSFFSSSFNLEQSFTNVPIMEELNVKIAEYNFYKAKGVSESQINEILNIKEDSQGRYLLVEQNTVWVRYNLPQ